MGCDIHMYIERKFASEKQWRLDDNHRYNDGTIEDCVSNRDYGMFWRLAGVRYGPGQPGQTRGLPRNVSYELYEDYCLHDYHSPSWCTAEELLRTCNSHARSRNAAVRRGEEPPEYTYDLYYPDKYPYDDPWDTGWLYSSSHTNPSYNPFYTILKYIRTEQEKQKINKILLHDSEHEEFRIVFWFDS